MDRRIIRRVVGLAIVAILGLVLTQMYWVRQALDLREREFNDRVSVALQEIGQEVMMLNGDTTGVPNVRQMSSNYFVVSTTDTLHPYLLERMLRDGFGRHQLKVDFEYTLYDCFTDSVVFGHMVRQGQRMRASKERPLLPKLRGEGHYFGVYFPDKQGYITGQMGFWVFSSSALLVVIIFFGYTLGVILHQKRLSEIKNDFINNMTHEFKTPITTITASSEMLLGGRMEGDADKRKRYYQIILDESNRLKLQVEKVLQMAQFDKEHIKLNHDLLNMNELLADAVNGVQVLLEEHHCHIEWRLMARKTTVSVDALHMTNVLRNLIDNAVKYGPDGQTIILSTTDDETGIRVSVTDQGPGIAKNLHKEIFGKFYRVPTGDVHNVKGFGLGLYYVRSIVSAHGGRVLLQSEPGLGSTFSVIIPNAK